jgi:hypothetical protein
MEMTLSNLIFRDTEGQLVSAGTDITADLEKNSIYFTQKEDGSILSVMVAESESNWAGLFKKGVISSLQMIEDKSGGQQYTRSTTDVTGSHRTHYSRMEDGSIEGRFDQSTFDTPLEDNTLFEGYSRHYYRSEGVLSGARIRHRVRFGQSGQSGGTVRVDDDSGFIGKESEIVSEGELHLSLLSMTQSPKVSTKSAVLLSQVMNPAGYVATQLSDTHVEEAVAEDEMRVLEDVLKYVAEWMNIILHNPNNLKEKELYKVAHELWSFIQSRKAVGDVIREELIKARTAANARWVDFVVGAAQEGVQTAASVETATASNDNYPYNKAKDWSTKLGSGSFNMFAQAGYFAGTNFDCKQTGLNYKLHGYAKGGVHLFGKESDFFTGDAVYATISGATTENRVYAKLFGRVVKDEPLLPVIPGCPPEVVKTLAHAEPGFHVGFTIVVVIIPVSFSAGVTANLYLKWGYQLCPQNLQAHVDLRPGITLTASASATAHVLAVKGGIGLSGSINQEIRPTAMIDGNQCQFGVNLHRIQAPSNVKFYGWYEVWSCHFHHWHLKCGWGGRHEKTFWQWNGSGVDQPLWGELCQAQLHPFSVSCHEHKF